MYIEKTNPWQVNYDENEIPPYTLPDVLTCFDGSKVTTKEEWVNKRVTIIVSTTSVKRDVVPCLRIKDVKHEVKIYKCHVCGKELTEKNHNLSIEKYGVPLCSGECLAKHQEQNATKENNE